MKSLLLLPLIFCFTLCLAQPQWKFHIAFEDATGAKDTLWLIWDTTATGGLGTVDFLLGEGPAISDDNIFNVWIYNEVGDSTKTLAYPYNFSLHVLLRAFNYQYPITITWDTSLFHASFLPLPVGFVNRAIIGNDYFFGINNDPPLQAFNMLIDNYAEAPAFTWGSQTHFPMEFYVARDPSISVNENENLIINIYPNLFSTEINISSSIPIKEYEIITIDGKSIIKSIKPTIDNNLITISCEKLRQGIYFLKILNNLNQTHYEKIIKFH